MYRGSFRGSGAPTEHSANDSQCWRSTAPHRTAPHRTFPLIKDGAKHVMLGMGEDLVGDYYASSATSSWCRVHWPIEPVGTPALASPRFKFNLKLHTHESKVK